MKKQYTKEETKTRFGKASVRTSNVGGNEVVIRNFSNIYVLEASKGKSKESCESIAKKINNHLENNGKLQLGTLWGLEGSVNIIKEENCDNCWHSTKSLNKKATCQGTKKCKEYKSYEFKTFQSPSIKTTWINECFVDGKKVQVIKK